MTVLANMRPKVIGERVDRLEALVKAIWHVANGDIAAGDPGNKGVISLLADIAQDEASSLQRGITAHGNTSELECPN